VLHREMSLKRLLEKQRPKEISPAQVELLRLIYEAEAGEEGVPIRDLTLGLDHEVSHSTFYGWLKRLEERGLVEILCYHPGRMARLTVLGAQKAEKLFELVE